MMSRLELGAALILAQLILLLAAPSTCAQSAAAVSTPEQIKAEFDSVPCKNEERLGAAKAMFERLGAPESEVSVVKYKSVENLVVRKAGASQEMIVVGAHYDKVAEGCGAIDNWTGVVTVAHLYKSLKDVPLNKTVLFVAFGQEEKGLVGSHAMVGDIGKDQAAQYCEMVNIDSLGLAIPQVADNMSSRKLGALAADVAKGMKMQFSHASIPGADADSSSFLAKGIPAVTLHGLTSDWASILHSRKDQAAKVNPASVYLGYRLALALVLRLDSSPCGEYR
jgi:Zn-dependent M28 family amino/carboxypeptidase